MTRRRRRAVHPHRHGVRRPGRRVVAAAARPTYGPTAAGLGTPVGALGFNDMFVESVFFPPGFLWFTKRAIASDRPNLTRPAVNTLCGLAVWAAVLWLR